MASATVSPNPSASVFRTITSARRCTALTMAEVGNHCFGVDPGRLAVSGEDHPSPGSVWLCFP
jgi:hypothetical protein